jgi:hypothetical protein
MSENKRTILFWGPQLVYAWLPGFVVPAFEGLKQYGWTTTYFCPPLNEFNIGVPLSWKKDFENSPHNPDIRVIQDPICSTYHSLNDERIITALTKEFSGQNPDIIVTRTHGHSYMRKMFPHAVILSMADAIGAPWFGRGTAVFTITENEFFYGNPLLSQYPEQALDLNLSEHTRSEATRLMNTQQQLSERQTADISEHIKHLRQSYNKIFVMPVCSGLAETDYVLYAYDHQFMTQADLVYHFLANSPEDSALLITSHPFTPKPDVQIDLNKVFADTDRVIFSDDLDVDRRHFTTANIMPFCDGMINWLSKAYWHALICGKPLYDYGTHDISFAKPYKDVTSWLEADGPGITIEEALNFFYWSITRHRFRVTDALKIHRVLENYLNRPTTMLGSNGPANLYEWLDTEEEYQAYFIECIDQIRAERGL